MYLTRVEVKIMTIIVEIGVLPGLLKKKIQALKGCSHSNAAHNIHLLQLHRYSLKLHIFYLLFYKTANKTPKTC